MCNFFAQVGGAGVRRGWMALGQAGHAHKGSTSSEPCCLPACLPDACVSMHIVQTSHPSSLALPCLPPVLQPDALACGKDAETLRAEGVPDQLVTHKTFSGEGGACMCLRGGGGGGGGATGSSAPACAKGRRSALKRALRMHEQRGGRAPAGRPLSHLLPPRRQPPLPVHPAA